MLDKMMDKQIISIEYHQEKNSQVKVEYKVLSSLFLFTHTHIYIYGVRNKFHRIRHCMAIVIIKIETSSDHLVFQ